MLAYPVFFTNRSGRHEKKEVIYIRHSMLDFPLLITVTSSEYYLSTNYI